MSDSENKVPLTLYLDKDIRQKLEDIQVDIYKRYHIFKNYNEIITEMILNRS